MAEKIREKFVSTYEKGSTPLDVALLTELIQAGRVTGYVQREGELSNGESFSQVYLIVEKDKQNG